MSLATAALILFPLVVAGPITVPAGLVWFEQRQQRRFGTGL
ncbi:hypothetical protein [Skermania piniformis]|nr:hypothetical protein [Skermania piniformis]